MGEAVYYYKATFPETISSQLQEQLKAFHVEAGKAYDFWQNNRNSEPQKFWDEFATKFPVIDEYMHFLNGGNCNNALSGKISWGTAEDAENLTFQGNTARYYAEVWHFADWENLGNFMKKKFGAIDFRWLSDEDGDVSSMLDQPDTDEVKEAADLIKTVMNSCVTSCEKEPSKGGLRSALFQEMYGQLKQATKILGIDITGVKEYKE